MTRAAITLVIEARRRRHARRRRPWLGRAILPLLLVLAGVSAAAQPHTARAGPAAESFSELSLEELMNVDVVEVSSVTRQTRPLAETAAAAFVIGAEDIRRSGATSIPEVLRMVPGVEVARIDANKWAVTIRGFNGRFADKLLVMIDGISVYTPFFCNVFWDVQDLPLEDIARIEVIRGPGGSIWGANAVNGVINIITKLAEETQGALIFDGRGLRPLRRRHRPLRRQGRRGHLLPRLPQGDDPR